MASCSALVRDEIFQESPFETINLDVRDVGTVERRRSPPPFSLPDRFGQGERARAAALSDTVLVSDDDELFSLPNCAVERTLEKSLGEKLSLPPLTSVRLI